jgi:hypothetical protein
MEYTSTIVAKDSAKFLSDYKEEIQAVITPNQPNFVLAPMGSGKSKLITDLALEYVGQNKVLIVAPYKDNREAYTQACSYTRHAPDFENGRDIAQRLKKAEKEEKNVDLLFMYGTTMLADMMNQGEILELADEISGRKAPFTFNDMDSAKAHIERLANRFAERVTRNGLTILIDEYDFLKIQVISEGTSKWFTTHNGTVNVSAEVLLMAMLKALATHCTVIGFSATDGGFIKANQLFIQWSVNTILVDIPSSVTFASWSDVFVTKQFAKNQLFETLLRQETKRKVLVQTNKFNYKQLRILKECGRTVVVKLLTDKHTVRADKRGLVQTEMQSLGFKHLENLEDIKAGGAYYFNIGVQEEGDLEAMFDVADVIAVNTSNSRTVSILNTYAEEPLVINLELSGPTSNTIQTPGRFRNQPTRVVNIYEVEDVTADTLEVESIRVANSTYRLSPNQHAYIKDNNRYADIYEYVREFDTRIINSVKNAVGKALSETTRLRRATLQDYLSTIDLAEANYNHYKATVSKESLYKKSMFYIHLETFKNSGTLSWNVETRVAVESPDLIKRLSADIALETKDAMSSSEVIVAIRSSVETVLGNETTDVKESVIASLIENSCNAITSYRNPAFQVDCAVYIDVDDECVDDDDYVGECSEEDCD